MMRPFRFSLYTTIHSVQKINNLSKQDAINATPCAMLIVGRNLSLSLSLSLRIHTLHRRRPRVYPARIKPQSVLKWKIGDEKTRKKRKRQDTRTTHGIIKMNQSITPSRWKWTKSRPLPNETGRGHHSISILNPLKSLTLLSANASRDPPMRPTPNRQLEVRIRTQQHIPLLLLLLLLLSLLLPPPRHAQTGLSGPPVRIHAPLADGRHIAVIACRTHLTVLQLLV